MWNLVNKINKIETDYRDRKQTGSCHKRGGLEGKVKKVKELSKNEKNS